MTGIVISGYGLCMPYGTSPADLLHKAMPNIAPTRDREMENLAPGLGYPGQDAATTYAMGAVIAAGADSAATPGERLGVLVASTTSNIDAVARTAIGITQESYRAVRPAEVLTIAGTQVTASLSSWFDARAFAYGSCSGNAAGLDALGIARSAVRRQRADRVMVVGVETPGEQTRRMIAEADGERELFTGGAAVLVEAASADHPTFPQLAAVAQVETIEALVELIDSCPDLVFLPSGTDDERAEAHRHLTKTYPRAIVIDLTRLVGDALGALGVIQLVVAAEWLSSNPTSRALIVAGSLTDRHLVATKIEGGGRL